MSLNVNPEIVSIFSFWGGILALKILAMSLLTARQRFRKQVFANPEDTSLASKKSKVVFDDPDVERVRRAHLNDLENVVPWFIVTSLWIGTDPSTWLASLLIRTFVITRIIHTIVYAIVPFPQPARGLSFGVGFLTTGYMAVSTILHYSS
ncbi:microsomal glutathione S-transferase 1-like [Neodiprion virginianus]|uniref:microsomal glutathione S-transferase 1-like n=1 Tax=Neodiprion virginianus TaxID=2961670 RepID=UPI001EE6AAAC|nr:microsomal glutathione S-transferase 1-like [Neodiprion virginianus]